MENKKKSRRVLNAILAVGLAVALWLYVVNVENPTGTTRLRDLDVEIQGSRQLAEQGLMVTSISQDQLDLKVNGRKKTLMKLSPKNVSVYLDVSTIEEKGEWPLSCRTVFPSNVSSDSLTVANWDDLRLTVTVEEVETKRVPVQGSFSGVTVTGFMTGEIETELKNVEVTGPVQILDQIDHAQAQVGGEAVSATIEEDVELRLLGSDGTPVDSKLLTLSEQSTHVTVPVEEVVSIPLRVDLQESEELKEADVSWSISPSYVNVVKEEGQELPEVLNLGSIDLKGVYDDTEFHMPIQLPQGSVGWNLPDYATLSLVVDRYSSRMMPVEDIRLENIPEGLEAEQVTGTIFVWSWGRTRQLTDLKGEQLAASVDLSEAEAAPGIRRFPVTVWIEGVDGVEILGKHYTVALRLTEK